MKACLSSPPNHRSEGVKSPVSLINSVSSVKFRKVSWPRSSEWITIKSVPFPLMKVSFPSPPMKVSFPSPPLRVSSPSPPLRVSFPSPPMIMLFLPKIEDSPYSPRGLTSMSSRVAEYSPISMEVPSGPLCNCISEALKPSVSLMESSPRVKSLMIVRPSLITNVSAPAPPMRVSFPEPPSR